MKTLKILLTGLLLLGMSSYAQKIYVRGGLGIAASTAATSNYDFNTPSNGATTITFNKKGIGTGLPFVLAGGYKFNENFGIELAIDYFYGFSIKSKSTSVYYNSDSKWHGQMLSLVPAFVMSIPLEKFQPYARLGLKLGVMNSVITEQHQVINTEMQVTANDIQIKSKDYGGIAVGAQAAVGTGFKLSDRISLFGEIQLDGISYSPKHGKYTEYTSNGKDQLGSMSAGEKEWDYVNEAPFSGTPESGESGKQVKRNYMFGNVGLVLGVKVTL
jgi:hypothetical protein